MLATITCIAAFPFEFYLLYVAITEKNKNSIPFVYITFLTIVAILGKMTCFINAYWLIQNYGPYYQSYRETFGKMITLVSTGSYLIPLCLNWLMTMHRVIIFASPFGSQRIFSTRKLFAYCSAVTTLVLISLLIPYFYTCSVNFSGLSNRYESACAPNKHPITTFQNEYTVFMPVISMTVNLGIIIYLKATQASLRCSKWEKTMIRQAIAIAVYLSIYELGYQLIKYFPTQYASLPASIQSLIIEVRFSIVFLLNFLVYFVETQSTREMLLKPFRSKKKENTSIITVTAT